MIGVWSLLRRKKIDKLPDKEVEFAFLWSCPESKRCRVTIKANNVKKM